MGWCSGTEIFDVIVKVLKEDKSKEEIIKHLIDVLEDMDWDCQSDSEYWDDPEIREIFKELHPEYFEDEEDN